MTDRPAADDTAAPLDGEAGAAPELVPAEQVTAALEAAASAIVTWTEMSAYSS